MQLTINDKDSSLYLHVDNKKMFLANNDKYGTLSIYVANSSYEKICNWTLTFQHQNLAFQHLQLTFLKLTPGRRQNVYLDYTFWPHKYLHSIVEFFFYLFTVRQTKLIVLN